MKNSLVKKILFLDQATEIGGAELSLISIAKNISNSTVGVFGEGIFSERLRREGINVVTVSVHKNILAIKKDQERRQPKFSLFIKIVQAFLAIHNTVQLYEKVCFNTQKALVLGIIPAKLSRKKSAFFLRDIISVEHFSKKSIRLIIFCANTCNKVICNSEATKEAFIMVGGNATKAIVIYDGINSAQFKEVANNSVLKIKKKLKIENGFVIGTFSRIAAWKGQDVLIRAMRDLPDNFHCLIVGSPFFGEKKYFDKLKKMTNKYALANRLHFIDFTDDVPSLMSVCDVIVHTSIAPEPFGRVIVEGMMAGKPVIATNLGGAREIIKNNKTGFLVEPNNSKILSQAIIEVQKNKIFASIIARNGKKYAREKFNEKSMVDRVKIEIENL